MRSKKVFNKVLNYPNFRNGILLSSNTLSESLDSYLQDHHDLEKPFSKKERSLMEYLSRMYTKTSPFSTFTHVGLATAIKDDNNSVVNKTYNKIHPRSKVKLNHMIFGYLVGLLIHNKEISKYLDIKINFTVQKENNEFVFYSNNNNSESIQRIAITPALEIIYEEGKQKQTWVYEKFIIEILNSHIIQATQKELEEYVDNLLSLGFLEYDLGVSGIDPDWDKQLIKKLLPVADKYLYIQELIAALKKLNRLTTRYENATPEVRKMILHDGFTILRETCYDLHVAAKLPKKERKSFFDNYRSLEESNRKIRQKVFRHYYTTAFYFKPNNIWYEDSFSPNPFALPSKMKKSLLTLGKFLTYMGDLSSCLDQRYELAYFFKKQYGDRAKIDLLKFYEDFLAEKKKTKGDKLDIHHNPLVKARRKLQQKLSESFINLISNQLNNQEEIHITEKHISQFFHYTQYDKRGSFGAFIQFYSDQGKPTVVVNQTWPGFGKTFSRFLYLFDKSLTAILQQQNKKSIKNAMLAEGTDASLFNANIHPPLMPYQIKTPGGYNSYPESNLIQIADILVQYNQQTNRLQLFDKRTEKEIFIFDIGFQNIKNRSELYAILAGFTLGDHRHHNELADFINMKIEEKHIKSEIIVLPRVIYEETIVLQRKAWIIPKNLLPHKDTNETDFSYFLKINAWRTGSN